MAELNLEAADSPALPSSDPTKPRRGRPKGWRMPTFATLSDLTIEDFAFLRGIANGMSPAWSFEQFYGNVHFDRLGKPDPHGLEINGLARQLEARVQEAARGSVIKEVAAAARDLAEPIIETTVSEKAKAQTHMSFTDWFDSLPEDFYSENELEDRYREYLEEHGVDDSGGAASEAEQGEVLSVSQQIKRRIAAINMLQLYLSMRPTPQALTTYWLAPKLCEAFAAHRVGTLGEMMAWIALQGRHWHKQIHWFGPARAQRLMAWIRDHEETLGPLLTVGPEWQPSKRLSKLTQPLVQASHTLELVVSPRTGIASHSPTQLVTSYGIVPLEMLRVPDAMDGSTGPFRPATANSLNASNDYEAVQTWLASYLSAGKVHTFEAYRKEIERFYLWCLHEAHRPLSGVTLQEATAYQHFLTAIPSQYIYAKPVVRGTPQWKPFKGQLTPQSQNYALLVLRIFYKAMRDAGYMSMNPFAALKSNAAGNKSRVMDTTRTFHTADLALLTKAIEALPALSSNSLQAQASARRTKLLIHLAVTTGLRLHEISGSDLTSLRRARVDGLESDDWVIDVVGKGSKRREALLQEPVLAMIRQHHEDFEKLLMLGSPTQASERLEQFRKRPPLLAALFAPVGEESRLIGEDSTLANDNSSLSRTGIYKSLKAFVRFASTLADSPERAAHLARASTHWLRHTFAHEVLKANPGDDGLIMAQQLMGHASISTTAQYLKEDASKRIKAARRVRPLA